MRPDPATTLLREGIIYSTDEIDQQVQRIFTDPFFVNSDILRRFLSFVIDQTISGHAEWLKEYTIAVNVLQKSTDFKPQYNGIVRIHAGRLRRALHHYYSDKGLRDPIHIDIPKGRYVPVFRDQNIHGTDFICDDLGYLADQDLGHAADKQKNIAVLPFQHFNNVALENSLIDGLGLQLSNVLMQRFKKYSVVAYYSVRDVWKDTQDITKLASICDLNFLIAGNLQVSKNQVRSHMQLIDLVTGLQVLNCMYEGEYTRDDMFKLQDDIVDFFVGKLLPWMKIEQIDQPPKKGPMAIVP